MHRQTLWRLQNSFDKQAVISFKLQNWMQFSRSIWKKIKLHSYQLNISRLVASIKFNTTHGGSSVYLISSHVVIVAALLFEQSRLKEKLFFKTFFSKSFSLEFDKVKQTMRKVNLYLHISYTNNLHGYQKMWQKSPFWLCTL